MKNYKFIKPTETENGETTYLAITESMIETKPLADCYDRYGQKVGIGTAGDCLTTLEFVRSHESEIEEIVKYIVEAPSERRGMGSEIPAALLHLDFTFSKESILIKSIFVLLKNKMGYECDEETSAKAKAFANRIFDRTWSNPNPYTRYKNVFMKVLGQLYNSVNPAGREILGDDFH